MLQMLWHFLSSFFPRAGCQDSREGIDHGVKGTQAPALGDQMPTFLGKQNGRAEATEKRPTILLVVGPAEQFPKVTAPSRGPSSWAGIIFPEGGEMTVGGRTKKKKKNETKFGVGEMLGDEEGHKIWFKMSVITVNWLLRGKVYFSRLASGFVCFTEQAI